MIERQRKYEEGEPDLEQLQKEIGNETEELYLYLSDKNKPLHSHFLLLNQGWASASTCPVYVGSFQSKQIVVEALCNDIHTKLLNQWGTLSCRCGLVPKLQLSQTSRKKNKVFLECPKPREAKCRFFQWIHEPPKPTYVPKTAKTAAVKKRLNDMITEQCQKKRKTEEVGGFQFPQKEEHFNFL